MRLTWEVEAAVPMAFGRGVGWWSGTWGVALLEGCWRRRRGRGGGGRIAAGVELVQHWRMILAGAGMDGHKTNKNWCEGDFYMLLYFVL